MGTGAFVYFAGGVPATDTFTYVVTDQKDYSAQSTITITIGPVNDPPTVQNITVATAEEVKTPIALSYEDRDVGDVVTLAVVSQPMHAAAFVFFPQNNTAYYTPVKDFVGIDTFTYVANDGEFDSNIGYVTINVTNVNDVPIAFPITVQLVNEDPAFVILTCRLETELSGGRDMAIAAGPLTQNPLPQGNCVFTVQAGGRASGTSEALYSVQDPEGAKSSSVRITIIAPEQNRQVVGALTTGVTPTPPAESGIPIWPIIVAAAAVLVIVPLAFFLWKWFHRSKMNIIFTDDDVDESAMIEKSDYYGNRFARHINPMHAASGGEGAFAGDDAGMGGV